MKTYKLTDFEMNTKLTCIYNFEESFEDATEDPVVFKLAAIALSMNRALDEYKKGNLREACSAVIGTDYMAITLEKMLKDLKEGKE